mmetsp:Transcript_15636/g.23040  ORF Transcript_15636/g.23040 Transcript_15636/m.23040 type:complete len:418 (-) Transcript_15636:166-1419(-)
MANEDDELGESKTAKDCCNNGTNINDHYEGLLNTIRHQLITMGMDEERNDENYNDNDDENDRFRIMTPMDFDDTYELTVDDETGIRVEYLDFTGWDQLQYLPPAIFQLFSLRSLHLQKCYALHTIPPSIKKLEQLTELDLSRCTSLTHIPHEIWTSFHHLRKLSLAHCTGLEYLSRSSNDINNGNHHPYQKKNWDGLLQLEFLDLGGCTNLRALPSSLWCSCPKLAYLGLNGLTCVGPGLPSGIRHLHQLKTLNVRQCQQLKHLDDDGSFSEAHVVSEKSTTITPTKKTSIFEHLAELHSIFASSCLSLERLPMNALSNLSQLQVLSLDDCPHIPLQFKNKAINTVRMIRLLVQTRDQATVLELAIIASLTAYHPNPQQRRMNRLSCDAVDIIIQRVLPFLCGDLYPLRLFSFCFLK